MKTKILFSALLMAAASFSLQADNVDASKVRVYINPGHGSWTANDRPCTLVGHSAYTRYNTDTTSFFESNTNLQKAFGMLEALRKAGFTFDETLNQTGENYEIGAARDLTNNLVMSHVKCGPYYSDNGTATELTNAGKDIPDDLYYYNRALTEICEEVDANNIDYFISIHSNALTEGTTTNYLLFLYRGYDTPTAATNLTLDHQTTSVAMAEAAWPYAFANAHNKWTNFTTKTNIRGDIDFYGSATTTNNAYGYLGALRHHSPGYLVEGYFHTYQPARHRAMNKDVSRLEGNSYARGLIDYLGLTQQTTGSIYGIVRDKGTEFTDDAYTPNTSTNDIYLPLNGAVVTLKQNGTVIDTYTTDNYYNGAFVFADLTPGTYTVVATHEDFEYESEEIEVSVTANADVYPELFLSNATHDEYPDITVPGTIVADEYEFIQDYVDLEVEELSGKTVRRVIARDETLYILAHDSENVPTVLVYDAANKAVLANVSTSGTAGYFNAISDIQVTTDGYLVATNHSYNQFSAAYVDDGMTRGTNYIYKWANDDNGVPTGDPQVLCSSQLSANYYLAGVGRTMAYSGSLVNGKIIVPAETQSSGSNTIRYNIYYIVDGALSEATYNRANNATLLAQDILGTDYCFTTSPLNDDKFVTTSTGISPTEFKWLDVVNNYSSTPEGLADGSNTVAFFRYNSHAYMVTADNDNNVSTGFRLNDVTNGFGKAQSVGLINTTIDAGAEAAVAASVVAITDDNDNVTGAYLNVYLVRDGKLTHYTTKGIDVEPTPNPLAYELKNETTGWVAAVSFKSTADVDEAYIILTNSKDETDQFTIPVSVKKGDNYVVIDHTQLTKNTYYNWSVKLCAETNLVSGEYLSDASGLTTRGSIVPITDPEYDSFGYFLVGHGTNAGLDIYNPEGTKVQTRIHQNHTMFGGVTTNQSNPFRGNELNGEAVLATWGDAGYGAVRVNLLDPNDEPTSLFAGTKASSGAFTYEGVNLGGGTSGICFAEENGVTVMYSFSEDHDTSIGAANNIVRYVLDANWLITEAPTLVGYNSRLANTNVDLQSYGKGIFASQVRYAGNNTSGNPGFVYISTDDYSELFNSSTLNDEAYGSLTGCNSGVAITHDGKVFAALDGSDAYIYDVTWNDNVPSFTYRYKFDAGSAWSMARFDYAGNLLVYERENGGLHCYALAQESPVVTVPAKTAEAVLVTETTGVDEISVDNDDSPAVYYNLNGIEVGTENMVPGVYIEKKGTKTRKVLIK